MLEALYMRHVNLLSSKLVNSRPENTSPGSENSDFVSEEAIPSPPRVFQDYFL